MEMLGLNIVKKNSPDRPSSPTDPILRCRRDKPLQTSPQIQKTLLGKSKGNEFRLINWCLTLAE